VKQVKIVIAIDSFKGSASSLALGEAARRGVIAIRPDADVAVFPIADGGEGTMTALAQGLGGTMVEVPTTDLLGQPMTARYLLTGDCAVIEAAEVVGIDKITPTPQTFQKASTEGLAALFLDAKRRDVREIVIALGGTGTSDGGLGLLRGLGATVRSLPDFDGINLAEATRFDGITITALADVTNPYAGPLGFAKVFAHGNQHYCDSVCLSQATTPPISPLGIWVVGATT